MIVAVHSYKGGTGKTLLSVNLATLLAKTGNKVCLLDLDFRAPSLHAVFKSKNRYWMNQYVNSACKIGKVLTECKAENMPRGKLYVGLANPSIEAIRDMTFMDRKQEMDALRQLLSLKSKLIKEMFFDYVFLDVSPGLGYSSINAVLSADVLLVVTTLEKSDVEGTSRMFEFYRAIGKKTGIIVNKVPADSSSKIMRLTDEQTEKSFPVIGIVPCFCDILSESGDCLFPCEKPHHPFTRNLSDITSRLKQLWINEEKREPLTFEVPLGMSPSVIT